MASVRVAAAQFYSGSDVSMNLARCVEWLDRAAEAGARLLVLPENSNRTREDYGSRDDAWRLAEDLDGTFVSGLREACARQKILCAVGVDLRGTSEPDVHISSILIGANGDILHVHNKHIFWDYEYTLFTPGDEPVRAIDTEIGRIGLLLCADGIVPEVPRLLGLAGAQILANSLNSRGPDEHRVHIPLRAIESHVWHVAANTVGGPPDAYPWMGGSQVVSPTGKSLVSASETAEELILADIEPALADDKDIAGIGPLEGWRRPDLYGVLTKPVEDLPVATMYGPAGDAPSRPILVAPLQVSWFHSTEWTVRRTVGQISYAARRGVRLGVLPEYFCFEHPEEIADDPAAAAKFSTEVLEEVQAACRIGSMWVIAHLVEADGDSHYSTAYLIDAAGRIAGRYRKTHLDEAERSWCTPGSALPVFQTEVGVLGIMLGREIWAPEVGRVLTVSGAEIICHPTSWDRDEQASLAATERAEENRVHVISCTRLDSPSRIGSQVVQADEFVPGQPIALMRYPTAWTCRPQFEEQMAVTLDLREAHSKVMGFHLDPVATRQPHLYGPLTAAPTHKGSHA